jgi:hypothetical protein
MIRDVLHASSHTHSENHEPGAYRKQAKWAQLREQHLFSAPNPVGVNVKTCHPACNFAAEEADTAVGFQAG